MNRILLSVSIAAFVSVTDSGVPVWIGASQAHAVQASDKERFGILPDGREVFLYTLRNENGMEAKITNYGGIIVVLSVPDRHGKVEDVVLGYDSLARYVETRSTMGALIGRYANRIGNAKFTLNGTTFQLSKNSGQNQVHHIHGGAKGFHQTLWNVDEEESEPGRSLVLTHFSPDGQEGYPGNLMVKVIYTLTGSNELKIDYTASTDKPTVMNVTNHAYFNLAGAGNGDILNHELYLDADRFTPIDESRIPTGELRAVSGTPMDFTKPGLIGSSIETDDDQLKITRGYDHNWVLNKPSGSLGLAARVFERNSGRVMEVWTTEPGVQFFTANSMSRNTMGKEGKPYGPRFGLCLETQHFPDSPNKSHFPSTVLDAGRPFSSTTIYRFHVRK
ncbi:MAG: galactose mutarotase [Ignavibacteriales bacterium]|nr:galactose mutarotase [Ignavibacteriales bacterium]